MNLLANKYELRCKHNLLLEKFRSYQGHDPLKLPTRSFVQCLDLLSILHWCFELRPKWRLKDWYEESDPGRDFLGLQKVLANRDLQYDVIIKASLLT